MSRGRCDFSGLVVGRNSCSLWAYPSPPRGESMEAKKDAISSSPPAETPSRTLVLQGNNQEGSREDTKSYQ
eukprot:1047064-Amorphochlora_amoeboformis.AAC.1